MQPSGGREQELPFAAAASSRNGLGGESHTRIRRGVYAIALLHKFMHVSSCHGGVVQQRDVLKTWGKRREEAPYCLHTASFFEIPRAFGGGSTGLWNRYKAFLCKTVTQRHQRPTNRWKLFLCLSLSRRTTGAVCFVIFS